jgi:hypothetical protein
MLNCISLLVVPLVYDIRIACEGPSFNAIYLMEPNGIDIGPSFSAARNNAYVRGVE